MRHAVYLIRNPNAAVNFQKSNLKCSILILHVFTFIPKQCGKFLSSLVFSFSTCMGGIRGTKNAMF